MDSLANFRLKAQPGYQLMNKAERTQMQREFETRLLYVRYFWLLRRKEQFLGITTEKTDRYVRMSVRTARIFKEMLEQDRADHERA